MKIGFETALELLNSDSDIEPGDVQFAALRAHVWVAEVAYPGCLPESRIVCASREGAIDTVCWLTEGLDVSLVTIERALRRDGCITVRGCDYMIYSCALRNLIGD